MPLSFITKLPNNTQLGFWHLAEKSEELLKLYEPTSAEMERFASFSHDLGKRQFIAIRLLLKKLAGKDAEMMYDENGKPFSVGLRGLSVSHTQEYALLAITPRSEIGVDIEKVGDRIMKIRSKFVSPEEEDLLEIVRAEKQQFFYHLLWSFKEAAYKLYGKKGLLFKEQIRLLDINYDSLNTLSGEIRLPDQVLKVSGNFNFIGGFVICICYFS